MHFYPLIILPINSLTNDCHSLSFHVEILARDALKQHDTASFMSWLPPSLTYSLALSPYFLTLSSPFSEILARDALKQHDTASSSGAGGGHGGGGGGGGLDQGQGQGYRGTGQEELLLETSRRVIARWVLSCPVLSCPVMSCLLPSYPVLFYPLLALYCPVLSSHTMFLYPHTTLTCLCMPKVNLSSF